MTPLEIVTLVLACIGALTVIFVTVRFVCRLARRGRQTTEQIGRAAAVAYRDSSRTVPAARSTPHRRASRTQGPPTPKAPHPAPVRGGSVAETFTVSIDGACPDKSGAAGWAWVNELGQWVAAAQTGSTLAAAELTSLIEALEAHAGTHGLIIRTDSKYAHGTVTAWMDSHAARNWKTTSNKDVKNVDLIKRAIRARDARRALGLPDAEIILAERDRGPASLPTDLWAYACAVRGLRHARNGGTHRWAHNAEHGEFAVDLTRRPSNADLAPATATT